jgi:hypothetical protein
MEEHKQPILSLLRQQLQDQNCPSKHRIIFAARYRYAHCTRGEIWNLARQKQTEITQDAINKAERLIRQIDARWPSNAVPGKT